MQEVKGRIKKMAVDFRTDDGNPFGSINLTLSCDASEANILALNRLRTEEVILVSAQEGLFEGGE